MKSSIVRDKRFAFALRIIALSGISRAGFVSQMAIASKEAWETHYWLGLLRDSILVPEPKISPLANASQELVRILTAIVKTSQTVNQPNTKN